MNKITLMSLEEKEITHICEMEKVIHLQNLHLSRNHIYTMENLEPLQKLRVLKIENNELVKISGLTPLINLEQLFLADNHISHFEGLTNNRKLHIVHLNNQKTKYTMTFEEDSC